jgi:hypothetical protein
MGLGLALLANSRPYESLFFFLPVAGVLLLWIFRGAELWQSLRQVVFPIVGILFVTSVAML